MFSKIWTMKSTENYSDNINRLKQASNGVQGVQTRLKRKDRFESK